MKIKFIFIIFSLFSTAHAADLIFTPATPVVEINKQIQLSVSGASGDVTWNASKGKIVKGTYIAPDQPGLDVVTAFDNQGNVGTLKIIVITPTISLENSVWKVFTNRSWITALQLSADNNTLYVGTWGGLEERDAKTGEIKRIWTNLDGLPENRIRSIITDNNGELWVGTQAGLAHLNTKGDWEIIKSPNNQIWSLFYQNGIWLGTENGGLAYRNTKGDWQVFNTENSKLPNNNIRHITGDTKEGIWIATVGGGIAHRHADGNWEIFNTNNSNLPDNNTNTILADSEGGIWVGTAKGLAHRDKEGRWNIFNSDIIYSIIHDAKNGIWIGSDKGLTHRDKDGKLEIFNTENSGLPDKADFFFPLVNGSPTSPKGAVLALLTDKRGGIWVGTWAGGLARRNADTSWKSFYNQNSLTDIDVQSSAADGKSGIWIGTNKGGLVHRNSNGKWQKFNTDNSGLPDNSITAITTTDTDLWVGSFQNGLANRDINGNWKTFKTYNSPLPSNTIISLLIKDGLWIGTLRGGLAHRYTDNTWKIFNTQNSELASNNISVLVADNQNGLWIGTLNGGLAYLRADNTWNIFNTDNSNLPSNNIYSLLLDNNNSLWVGTDKGLAHRKNDGSWEIPKKIPTKPISSLITDERGDIWIGTYNGLIYYRHTENKLTIFNTENSGLPGNGIDTLVSDGLGGIWVGGNDLAHLTFGTKSALCTTNKTNCEKILLNKNAAIIIAGGGNHSENTLWDTTESIANYTYKVLNKRGFLNENIFYINPRSWADFNGDGLNDRIVDAPKPERPLKVEDIRDALTWAKKRGKLDQPLYIFFIDHGGDTKFQLSKLNDMSAAEFKTILDDYQKATDNEIVLVMDACHSGNLLKQIIAPKRSIISSTGTGLAYFDRENKKGFGYFFASGLLRGMSFFEAFEYSSAQQAKLLGNITKFLVGSSTKTEINFKQEPQFEDGNKGDRLRKLFINGSFVTGDTTLAIESLTTSTTIAAGKTITLKAQIALAQGQVKKAWAVIIPPKINLVMDSNGTPLLAFPRILLSKNQKNPNLWERNWQAAVYNGDYQIRFYAEDDQSNIASSDKELIITVNAGVNSPSEANVELLLTKTNYKPGEQFKAELIENLNWGYDLYAALILPDNNFIAIQNTNKAAAINKVKQWQGKRTQTNKITLFDLTLPDNLAKGEYCLYGILSPAKEAVLETVPLWVIKKQCFHIL